MKYFKYYLAYSILSISIGGCITNKNIRNSYESKRFVLSQFDSGLSYIINVNSINKSLEVKYVYSNETIDTINIIKKDSIILDKKLWRKYQIMSSRIKEDKNQEYLEIIKGGWKVSIYNYNSILINEFNFDSMHESNWSPVIHFLIANSPIQINCRSSS